MGAGASAQQTSAAGHSLPGTDENTSSGGGKPTPVMVTAATTGPAESSEWGTLQLSGKAIRDYLGNIRDDPRMTMTEGGCASSLHSSSSSTAAAAVRLRCSGAAGQEEGAVNAWDTSADSGSLDGSVDGNGFGFGGGGASAGATASKMQWYTHVEDTAFQVRFRMH